MNISNSFCYFKIFVMFTQTKKFFTIFSFYRNLKVIYIFSICQKFNFIYSIYISISPKNKFFLQNIFFPFFNSITIPFASIRSLLPSSYPNSILNFCTNFCTGNKSAPLGHFSNIILKLSPTFIFLIIKLIFNPSSLT